MIVVCGYVEEHHPWLLRNIRIRSPRTSSEFIGIDSSTRRNLIMFVEEHLSGVEERVE